MKKLVVLLSVALSMFVYSCSTGNENAVQVSEDMQNFLSMIKGSADDVANALAKYGATTEITDNDMALYELKDPVVVAKEGDCYNVEFKAGLTTRVYIICWKEGKITQIVDKGIKQ